MMMWEPVWWSTSNPALDRALTHLVPEITGSFGTDFDQFFLDGGRDGLVVLLQAGDVPLDGVCDVGQRLLPGLPLSHRPGERRAFGDVGAVFVLVDCDAVFHNPHDGLRIFNACGCGAFKARGWCG